MKILMLVASLDVGGAETHLFELCRTLVSLGNVVTVASNGGRLCEELKGFCVNCVKIPLDSKRPHSLLFSYIALRKLIKKEGFDIVHAHSRIAALVGSAAAKKEKKCFVTTVHANFRDTPLLNRFTRWGYRSIAVSEDLAAYLCEHYSITPERISVIPNGIDTDRFKPREKEGKGILFVSRLDADSSDAAYSLCRIAHRLADRHKGITVRICGGGSEYHRLSIMADKINLELGYHCISLLGGGRDIAAELDGSKVFVGVSRCALEAMSSGVPTFLAGNEGMLGTVNKENVKLAAESNFCCRGCPPIDDKKLLYGISELLELKDNARKELSDFLRSYVSEHNSAVKMARETLEFYKRTLGDVSFEGGGICLCGYYGYGNTGDETLLELAIKRARERGGVNALAHSPRASQYRFGIPCVNRYNPFSVLDALLRSRTLVFGGGTLFQDRTSLRSMLYYLSVAECALVFGKRIELWGNGLCMPKYRYLQAWLRHILRHTAYIGLRDKPSLDIARSLCGAKAKIRLEGDLALSMSRESCRSSFRTRRLCEELERYALFALCKRSTQDEYRSAKKTAVELKEKGITPIVIAMYPAEDREICRTLAIDSGGRYAEGLSAFELISLLGNAELCISARLHLLIFARIADIPFYALGDDPKLAAFCRENKGENKPFH